MIDDYNGPTAHLWREFCKRRFKTDKKEFHWFSRNTAHAFDDHNACKTAAQNGDDRAKKMMVEFIAFKMKS